MKAADISPFFEPYVLANTPEYLLTKFLVTPALDSIIRRYNSAQLFEAFKQSDQSEGTASEIVSGYVALVALLKLSETEPEILAGLRVWTPKNLRWLQSMLVYWDDLRIPTSVEKRTFIKISTSPDAVRSDTGNSSVRIVVPS